MPDDSPPSSADRRSRRAHQRYVLVGQAATLRLGDATHPCTIRNISSAGLMASVYEADLSADRAVIELPTGECLSGAVLWARDWQLGLAFDTPVDVDRLLASLADAAAQPDRRADARIEVDCAAKLRVERRFYFGRLADISCAGARFRTNGQLKRSGPAQLILPDLPPLRSTIRWTKDEEFGLQFEERLPPRALDLWLADRT